MPILPSIRRLPVMLSTGWRRILLLGALATAGNLSLVAIDGGGDMPRAAQRPLATAGEAAAGIRFACGGDARRMAALREQMRLYLARQDIPAAWVGLRERQGALTYTLNTPADDSSTLDFARRQEMKLQDAVVRLPTDGAGGMREVRTVSQKEIVLALLQRGRLTEFPCDAAALEEHVGIRQNIVAWAEDLDWIWPDGDTAQWNEKYWTRGTPRPAHPLHEAVNNAFMEQGRYGIGCYTATKLVILQGVLDYYRRVRPAPAELRRIEAGLAVDGEPLVGIEPGAMWFFEDDYTAADGARPGKLVSLQQGVAADNFVPGDWSYLLNTDADSHRKTGYEGSSTIYLGRDRFTDYYRDHNGFYSFREKLDEVYQWRHGVFSRSRDAEKIRPLPEEALLALASTPEAGGLLASYRGVVHLGALRVPACPACPDTGFRASPTNESG